MGCFWLFAKQATLSLFCTHFFGHLLGCLPRSYSLGHRERPTTTLSRYRSVRHRATMHGLQRGGQILSLHILAHTSIISFCSYVSTLFILSLLLIIFKGLGFGKQFLLDQGKGYVGRTEMGGGRLGLEDRGCPISFSTLWSFVILFFC